MSTLAQRISETPMAPYIDVMKSMTVSDMNVVVDFLNEAIRESEEAKRKADDEFLARKMAEINISPETHELFEWLRLTPEEAADERTRYILGER
jgi:hypothetical protein